MGILPKLTKTKIRTETYREREGAEIVTKTREVGRETVANAPGIIFWAVAVLFALIALSNTFYSNDPGEASIEFNRLSGEYETKGDGLHAKVPFFESKWRYDVKDRIDTAPATAASSDLQVVQTTITVRYHPDPQDLQRIHQTIGTAYESKVIRPAVQESVKACTAKFTYTEMVQERASVKACMTDIIRERLSEESILTDAVDIVNFEPPSEITHAITLKEAAKQEAQRQEALKEAEQAKADQKVIAAQAEADAARIIGEQVAAHGEAYLFLQWISAWQHGGSQVPQTFVLGDSATQPFLMLPAQPGGAS